MPDPRKFRARSCAQPDCGLRFPVEDASPLGAACPRCGEPTEFCDEAYATVGIKAAAIPSARVEVEALLDNIRSLRNVGSMFRTADGAGIRHMHLCGVTPTPDHPKLAKTSLGAEKSVAWTHYPDATVAAASLIARGYRLWALEGGPDSVPLYAPSVRAQIEGEPIVIVFGHEVSGVDARLLAMCERVVHLPMLGVKDSLNVSVTLGIAGYTLRFS